MMWQTENLLESFGLSGRRLCRAFIMTKTRIAYFLRNYKTAKHVLLITLFFPKRILLWGYSYLVDPASIYLSQRLSHACLSTSTCTVKLQMAHQISYGLFDCTFYYMDTCGKSRTNTCAKILTSGRDVFIRFKTSAI